LNELAERMDAIFAVTPAARPVVGDEAAADRLVELGAEEPPASEDVISSPGWTDI
jgi:hypothetical protein